MLAIPITYTTNKGALLWQLFTADYSTRLQVASNSVYLINSLYLNLRVRVKTVAAAILIA
jgi:hypothetical protein